MPSAKGVTLAIALAVLLLTGLQASADDPPSTISGITKAFLDVKLSASVPGIITTFHFKEGDFVKAGQTIIELDKQLEALEVERRQVLKEARRIDYEGTAQLYKTTKGTSKEELEKKEADYKQAEVELAMATEQLHRRELVAPLSGNIVELNLEIGESCQPYQPMVRVVDTRQCYFLANIEAKVAATLKMNQKVKLEIETGGEVEPVTGTITFLSSVADAASGLVKLKVLFENPAGKIRPGLSGNLLLK